MSAVLDHPAADTGSPPDDAPPRVDRATLLRGLAGYGIAAAACGWVFRASLSQLPHVWDVDPNYSHGYIVPLAFLMFVLRQWKRVGPPVSAAVSAGDLTAGMIRIIAGLAIHFACHLLNILFFDVVGMIVLLTGVTIILAGKERYRAYAFPLWFLVFMAPLPMAWYQKLAIGMQQIASAVSTGIFTLCGIPAYREGCYVSVPGYQMEVGAACSGLRQLAAIVALSLAVGHLSNRTAVFKWALGLLAVPIAIAANCIRVTLSGFILMGFGREWAEGVYHTLEGLAIVGVAAVLILLTAWWLSRYAICRQCGRRKAEGGRRNERDHSPLTTHHSPLHLLLMSLVLAAAVCAQFLLDRHLDAVVSQPSRPLKKPLAAFPRAIGPWQAQDMPIDEREAAVGDEALKRVYVDKSRRQRLTLWMVYSTVGADRSHHPEVCMAVAGQPEDRSARRSFAVPGHAEPIQQYRFGRTGRLMRVFYWYYTLPTGESDPLDGLQRRYRATHFRPSSVTLEVFAPENGCDEAAAREFVTQVDAAIQAHVGKGAIRESRRIPVTVINEARPPQIP
jgi:exosortase